MRKTSKVLFALIIILVFSLSLIWLTSTANNKEKSEVAPTPVESSALSTESPETQTPLARAEVSIGGLDNDIWFTKYGNVNTDCKSEVFLGEMGYAMGDMVLVRFLDQALVLPVVPTYSYVDTGSPAIIVHVDDNGLPIDTVSLAINMGSFGESYGLATKCTNEEGQWWWLASNGVEFPVSVSFEMSEPAGYYAQYTLRSLSRTNERSDYPHLSDAEFANFREITSSSPINPELGRNTYACDLLEKHGVTVIMNLADSVEEAQEYEGFSSSYYARQNVVFLNMGVDFASADFKTSLAAGLRFFAQNPGTYAVHCTEGKDRAGFVSALLECLMGASCQEVIDDYLVTYYNYYGVEPGTEKAELITESNIYKILCDAFELSDPYAADLSLEAAEYIRSLGLSDEEIAQLKHNLSN